MEITNNNQTGTIDSIADTAFATDVLKGLQSTPKYLESKYFYNDKGSVLFQEIMNVPEYYLTRAEEEIFTNDCCRILETFTEGVENIDIVELGAGDGIKTKVLLHGLNEVEFDYSYTAIDISSKALDEIKQSLKSELPELSINLIENDYLQGLSKVTSSTLGRKVLLFLGSNIGNLSHVQSAEFLSKIRATLLPGDLIMIGFDLRKSPDIILKAYNDAQGITAAFNLNLLSRINEDLGGEFNLHSFAHVPVYDQEKGEARSYLKSLHAQDVWIEKLDKEFKFAENELIHTEISRKYLLTDINEMAEKSGFKPILHLKDSKGYFCDSIWKAI